MQWNSEVKAKYDTMLKKIPVFHRGITDEIVKEKAPMLAAQRGSGCVEECDVVRAFTDEVPKCFYSMMIRLMDDVGLDHKKYDRE
ncbi:MAG: hypothetical protein HQL26_06410 [Candidatus Omnitrophica bacterium]|nr:hypothetical protein [Candidatus Omnitrophota bacterium]